MQILYRDTKGRFTFPPGLPCSQTCSIFFTCKKDKLNNIGKPCVSRARLPEIKRHEVYDVKTMARQEREIRMSVCEGGD